MLGDTGKAGGDTEGTLSMTRMRWKAPGVTGTYWKILGILEGHWRGTLGGTGMHWEALGNAEMYWGHCKA